MEDSPMISPTIKEYASKYKIEKVLNNMINDILTTLPEEPFSEMSSMIKEVKYKLYNFIERKTNFFNKKNNFIKKIIIRF